jgi:phosphoribosylanthranilate isomerase
MTSVKICGITNWRDAKLAVDLGAQFLGFNFYRQSARYIEPQAARRIIAKLPKDVSAVGVFVNERQDVVESIGYQARLDSVQLHGEELPRMVGSLAQAYGVIKAFRVKRGFRAASLGKYPDAAAFLLDGFDAKKRGGTGKTFDWSVAVEAKRYGFVFLAGGLTPENVAAAIRAAHPFAVDVASGVESSPGKKDAAKLKAFMEAVERAQDQSRKWEVGGRR